MLKNDLIICNLNSYLLRGFCRPVREGRGGKGFHQTEETVGILGSTPLSEPVGLHRSGAGNAALCGVNTHNKSVSFKRHFYDKLSFLLRQTSTGRLYEQMLSTTWT